MVSSSLSTVSNVRFGHSFHGFCDPDEWFILQVTIEPDIITIGEQESLQQMVCEPVLV